MLVEVSTSPCMESLIRITPFGQACTALKNFLWELVSITSTTSDFSALKARSGSVTLNSFLEIVSNSETESRNDFSLSAGKRRSPSTPGTAGFTGSRQRQ
ncbi:MAG: hypothetical protein ACOCXD_02110 [Bacteroidota bacterium]